jgi:Family of unknown function (DUF6491)
MRQDCCSETVQVERGNVVPHREMLMKVLFVACTAAILLGACQTKADDGAEAKIDARQGKEVSSVCFSQQIRNWKALDRNSIIIVKNRDEEFKLDLVGACRPEDAFTSIGLVSRVGGGSCLGSGDQLVTDSRFNSGPCSIRRIYEWHADQKPADDAKAATK